MIGGHVSQTLGMAGYPGIVMLPLAMIGAMLVPVVDLWSLIAWLRR